MSRPEKLSEWEKMKSGQSYLAKNPELEARRLRARRITRAYNRSSPDDLAARRRLLEELLKRPITADVLIEPPFHCDYGENIILKGDFYANFGLIILDCAPVIIGDKVMIGPGSQLCTATHPLEAQTRAAGLEYARPVAIGSRTWLGAAVVVLPGVTIGEDAVIGAGSVVTKDIPAGVLAFGNPCRVVKDISSPPY